MDKAGLLTYGFEELKTMITWYHNPYQKEHLKKLDIVVENESEKDETETKIGFRKYQPDRSKK